MFKETTTISKNDDGTYNLLIQDKSGRVVLFKRRIPLDEAIAELKANMEEENG